MSQVDTVEAEIAIEGNVSGQMAVGNYNVQIQNSKGIVVNMARPADRPAYSLRPSPINLRPRAFPSLLDRDAESESIKVAVQTSAPVSIFGEKGIGKTSFVRRLIHFPDLPEFPTGIVYLDVSGCGLDDLLQLLFDTFYESEYEFKPRDAEIRLALQGLKALVFLDGLNLTREEVVCLLDAAPNCTFILSSLERSLWGEGQAIFLKGLPEKDALTLFQRELGRSMNEEEQATARKICVFLQGHPLRILQAASLAHEKSKPISEIWEDVQREVPERSVVPTSLNALTENQKRVLALLAAAGGFVMPLEHLVSLSQDPHVRETLQGLIALRLVQAHSPRYSLTGNLALSLATLWDLSSWEDALLNHFINWLEEQPAQALIEESAEAVLYTVKKAGEKEQWTQVVRLGRALERGLILWRRWQAWSDLLNLILKAAKALGDRKAEAWALHQLGSRAMCLGQADPARELLTEALNIRKAIRDRAGQEVTQHNLNVLLRLPNPPNRGNSGGRPWSIGGSGFMIALLMAALLTYVALSSFAPPPLPTATLIPTITETFTSTPSRTPTSTSTSTATATATQTLRPTHTATFTPTIATDPPLACSAVLTGLQNANCRTGPSKAFDPPYGTLLEGQTVNILGVNPEGTWFLVDHPQSFRYPCWVWNGPAVQMQGDLSCIQAVVVPDTPQDTAQSPNEPSQSEPVLGEPPPPGDYCSSNPSFCMALIQALQQISNRCPSGASWDSSKSSCVCDDPNYYWNGNVCIAQPH